MGGSKFEATQAKIQVPIQKITNGKKRKEKRAVGMVQEWNACFAQSPEFKSQYCAKGKRKEKKRKQMSSQNGLFYVS
jgi:hypothetical protein